uniref:uncharacterized protein LOC122595716 n=1 Tax=Erigeron canadensis TaxID=72917 RepID=UPI001CB99D68|nr:uncharacterized protein LOC122595716 [Erigeron canadensis]
MPETITESSTPPTSSNMSDNIESVHHPLYLHPNDHPGLILIAKKLTGNENYSSWKRSMMIALSAKNKLKIITGELKEPSTDSPLKAVWDRTNDMVISWILNSVSESTGNNLRFVHTASALWKELGDHYAQLDGHRMFQITADLTQLKQNNMSIEVYYQNMKGFWDELDALEAPYDCICNCACENGKTNGERE